MNEDQDLPLSSMNSDYLVKHYVIQLDCKVDRKLFIGVVQLLIYPSDNCQSKVPNLILDSCDITVQSVSEVDVVKGEVDHLVNIPDKRMESELCRVWLNKATSRSLDFSVEKWCTTISITGEPCPKVVRIQYETQIEGKSIIWTLSDDGRPCVLTAGSLINNRSLLPYQDAPSLMATWQLLIKVPEYFTVVTTGDGTGASTNDNFTYFYTRMLLPLSTFALAIGQWHCQMVSMNFPSPSSTIDPPISCHHTVYECPFQRCDPGPGLPTRLFRSSSIDVSSIIDYLPPCYEALYDILGRHLIPKLDVVILPKSVSYLGLTSPGLILLSPSVFYGSQPMLDRLAHEISHSWFGVQIGPRNWNEEWISEGFATFMEDVVDLKLTTGLSPCYVKQWMALKALNRYEVLKSDCQNIESTAQKCASDQVESSHAVRNGLNTVKLVSQIPYLKGYFFLHQLSSLLGLDLFLVSLKKYVERYHGTLVSTDECIEFFCCQHDGKRPLINQAANQWLYSSQLADYSIDNLNDANELYREVQTHFEYWSTHVKRKRSRITAAPMPFKRADQLIALFDRLLILESRFSSCSLQQLIDAYQPHLVNATLYHRFCELVIVNRYRPALPLVRQFLIDHVAMGAYLYGELVLSDIKTFQRLAHQTYRELEPFLEKDFGAILRDILGL